MAIKAYIATKPIWGLRGKIKPKNAYKVIKGRYCFYCKLSGYEVKGCYFLFPEKAPKEWKDKMAEIVRHPTPKVGHKIRDEKIMTLYTKSTSLSILSSDIAISIAPQIEDLDLEDLDIDFDALMVFYILTTNIPYTNKNIDNRLS